MLLTSQKDDLNLILKYGNPVHFFLSHFDLLTKLQITLRSGPTFCALLSRSPPKEVHAKPMIGILSKTVVRTTNFSSAGLNQNGF
jgi:hypothetical protein